MDKCFYKDCKNIANTTEHVPPRCFFTKGNKKNLITVPSCNEHNNNKKLDDEYVRNIFSLSININKYGIELANDKTFRSLNQSPKLLYRTFKKVYPLDNINTIAFEIDNKRIENWIKSIAYAIYRKDFNKNYNANWDIIDGSSAIVINENKADLNNEVENRNFAKNFRFKEKKTSSPEIFKYFLCKENEKLTYKFIFFQSINYYAYTKK